MLARSLLSLLLGLVLGCPSGDTGPGGDDSGDSGDTAAHDTGLDAVCSEPTEVACVDDMISDLSLQDEKTSKGEIEPGEDGDDHLDAVDASAGGYSNASKNAYLYAKFTDAGLEKVELTDEEALESMDWDIAARRFIVRLNGGSSGPSCVGAAAVEGQTYAEAQEVPDGVEYQMDDFYDEDCDIKEDNRGLPGNPDVALGAWWTYPDTCVATTDQAFFVQLADGRVVKLAIETYYAEDGQEECNADGSTSAEGGYLTVRWRFVN